MLARLDCKTARGCIDILEYICIHQWSVRIKDSYAVFFHFNASFCHFISYKPRSSIVHV